MDGICSYLRRLLLKKESNWFFGVSLARTQYTFTLKPIVHKEAFRMSKKMSKTSFSHLSTTENNSGCTKCR